MIRSRLDDAYINSNMHFCTNSLFWKEYGTDRCYW